MADTYTSSFANGAAVDAALGKAETAIQPADLGTAAYAATTDFATADHAASHLPDGSNPLGSGTATDGQVLTADGLGGASWESVNIERRFAAASPYQYLGTAPAGSAESATVWTIARLDFTSGMVETHAYNVAWDDRASASYS